MSWVRHPYRLSSTRQLASADADRHIGDLVRLILLTGPGERLHRPEFGAGLGGTVLFEPVEDALLGMVKVRAIGSLERELGDRIEVIEVDVRRQDTTILALVRYRLKPAGAEQSVLVSAEAP